MAYSTLRRAFKVLGCRSRKEENGQWFWYLPGHAQPACEEVVKNMITAPEGIKGVNREFMPDNFTAWFPGRDPATAKFGGGEPDPIPPLGTKHPENMHELLLAMP